MNDKPPHITYRFHHLGIPTDIIQPNERYSEEFKMFTSDHPGDFRVQFHRFEADSPLHPLITTLPHVALQVDDLADAVIGKEILLGPYEPIEGFAVAIVNDNGVPIELIQTDLTPDEVWARAQAFTIKF